MYNTNKLSNQHLTEVTELTLNKRTKLQTD